MRGLALTVMQVLTLGAFISGRRAGDAHRDLSSLVRNTSTDGGILSVSTLVGAAVGILLVIVIIRRKSGASVREYLALRAISPRTLALAIALAAGMVILSDGLSLLLGKPIVSQFMIDVYQTRTWPLPFWFALVVAGPAVEDVYFRGFLLAGLKRSRLGDAGAVILISLVWALFHTQYDFYEVASIFVLGLVLGAVRIRTGSMWTTFTMHALANFVATVEVAVHVARMTG